MPIANERVQRMEALAEVVRTEVDGLAVKGSAMGEVNGGGMLTVKGGICNIN